jgi:hypothetical protein
MGELNDPNPAAPLPSADPPPIVFDPGTVPVGVGAVFKGKLPGIQQEGSFSDRASLNVFFVIADIVLIAILTFFVVSADSKDALQEFARVVMSPLLTILAGAAGYYFGKRDSVPADNGSNGAKSS